MAVVRDGELLLAVGSELRIASIAQVKANVEAHAEQGSAFSSATLGQAGHIGDYKVCEFCLFPPLYLTPTPLTRFWIYPK